MQFPSAWGIMIKIWGRVLLDGMSKTEEIQFFLIHKTICSNLNPINLKLFRNHVGIVVYYFFDPGLWVEIIFRNKRTAESAGIDFEIVDIRLLCTLVLVH